MAAPGPCQPSHTRREKSTFWDVIKRMHNQWSGQKENAKAAKDAALKRDQEEGQDVSLVSEKSQRSRTGHRDKSKRHSAPLQGQNSERSQRQKSRRHSDPTSADVNATQVTSQDAKQNISQVQPTRTPNTTGEYRILKAHKKVSRSHSVGSRRVSRPESQGCTSPNCACSVVRGYTSRLMLEDQQKAKVERCPSLCESEDSCTRLKKLYAERDKLEMELEPFRENGDSEIISKKTTKQKYERKLERNKTVSSKSNESANSDHDQRNHLNDNMHNEDQERSTEGSKDGINSSLEVQPSEVLDGQHMKEIVRQNSENSFVELRRMSLQVTSQNGSSGKNYSRELDNCKFNSEMDTPQNIGDSMVENEQLYVNLSANPQKGCRGKECSIPNCACTAVREYTVQLMEQDQRNKSAQEAQEKSQVVEKWLQGTSDQEALDMKHQDLLRKYESQGARPKSYQEGSTKEARHHQRPHSHSCTSSSGGCTVVKDQGRWFHLNDMKSHSPIQEEEAGFRCKDFGVGSRQLCSEIRRSIKLEQESKEYGNNRHSTPSSAKQNEDILCKIDLQDAEIGSRAYCSQITRNVKKKDQDLRAGKIEHSDTHETKHKPKPDRKSQEHHKSMHNGGCSSQTCACATVRAYTDNIIKQDQEKKTANEKKQQKPETSEQIISNQPVVNGTALRSKSSHEHRSHSHTDDFLKTSNDSPSRRIQRPKSSTNVHRRTTSCFPIMDSHTFKKMARQYNVKKQPHRTKQVLVRKGELHDRTEVVKYKSLVEVRDSLPDLLKATLEEKEQRREERKDLRKARNKRIQKNAKEILLSSSDYALRRRAQLPYYSSFPKNRTPPPLPALMNSLPNPPLYFREDSL